ncbi:probable calcium-binding protein CML25 [Magnolia sinica]|uniref:probable calcium-binding protein CML25 n=1 Tax=Magnolia sinica TaxID=86752 RepID=UPI00265A3B27|nr:probable calcium-binding protein CML25 [Magnolia sinica]
MSNLGHPASEEELQRMVREVDFDGDGFINLNEFIKLNTTGVDSTAILEELRNAFLIFDLDGNRSISLEELQRVLRSLGDESSMAKCRKMIRGVDCDGNGLTTRRMATGLNNGTLSIFDSPDSSSSSALRLTSR